MDESELELSPNPAVKFAAITLCRLHSTSGTIKVSVHKELGERKGE